MNDEKNRKILINNYCIYFDVIIEAKDILILGDSSPDNVSNYYYYKKDMNNKLKNIFSLKSVS